MKFTVPPISELSEATGYTYTHVSRVLQGKSVPSWQCARRLAGAMDITLDQFAYYLDHGGLQPQKQKSIKLWPLQED